MQVLTERFPETAEVRPELLAHQPEDFQAAISVSISGALQC